MRRKLWSDVSPDLLREIAGRLHVAADFVRFHAICKPWRNSHEPTTTNRLLPWFLLPTESSSPLRLRCVFSKSSYHVQSLSYPVRTNWVCSADGTTIWYLTVKQLRPTLHDPITGAVTELPPFPFVDAYWKEYPWGVIYGDGTILLYGFTIGHTAKFRMALLRPGELKWSIFNRVFETSECTLSEFCARYHGGRILVTMGARSCLAIMPDRTGDVLVPRPPMNDTYSQQYSYILESRGELLWASVQVQWYFSYRSGIARHDHTLSVSMHALEEALEPEKARWVMKDGHCLADRVLFLGSPNSFAMDASLLSSQGGCAYFVYHDSQILDALPEQFGVFRYNFVQAKSEFIEELPQEWTNEKCTWLLPQPTVAPIEEIIERKLQKTGPVTSPSHISHAERHYEHREELLS